MQYFLRIWMLSLALAAVSLSGCGVEPPLRWGVGAGQPGPADADPAQLAPTPGQPGCLPVLGGELVINEVLARPAGLDIDGDGLSNQRDEALELRLIADGPRHLDGVALRVAGQQRGYLGGAACHPPGTLLVVLGSTAGGWPPQPGTAQLHLSAQLALRDEGAVLALLGRGGGLLDQVTYPAAPAGRSLVRTPEGNRWAPLLPHPNTATGAGHSLGLCSDGSAALGCWGGPSPT